MFYHTHLLASKGLFASIWLVGTLSKSRLVKLLTRHFVYQILIQKLCSDIATPVIALALRLRASLLFGICLVYEQQTHFFVEDCSLLLRSAFLDPKGRKLLSDSVTLNEYSSEMKLSSITLPLEQLDEDYIEDVSVKIESLSIPEEPLYQPTHIQSIKLKKQKSLPQNIEQSRNIVDPSDINLLEFESFEIHDDVVIDNIPTTVLSTDVLPLEQQMLDEKMLSHQAPNILPEELNLDNMFLGTVDPELYNQDLSFPLLGVGFSTEDKSHTNIDGEPYISDLPYLSNKRKKKKTFHIQKLKLMDKKIELNDEEMKSYIIDYSTLMGREKPLPSFDDFKQSYESPASKLKGKLKDTWMRSLTVSRSPHLYRISESFNNELVEERERALDSPIALPEIIDYHMIEQGEIGQDDEEELPLTWKRMSGSQLQLPEEVIENAVDIEVESNFNLQGIHKSISSSNSSSPTVEPQTAKMMQFLRIKQKSEEEKRKQEEVEGETVEQTQSDIEEREQKKSKKSKSKSGSSDVLSFFSCVRSSSRLMIAKAFFHLTELSSLGMVRVQQESPYDDISIHLPNK